MFWHEPGELSGQECSQPTNDWGQNCGGSMRVVSIDSDPEFEWAKRQDRVLPDMHLDLKLKCIRCRSVVESALHHDDLWDANDSL